MPVEASLSSEIQAAIKQERTRIARAGGYARAKALSKDQLRESAINASKAAAKARKKKARERKRNG